MWAPFVILRAIEGMVTVGVVSLVALTFEFLWKYKPIGASPCMYEKYIDVVMDNVVMILNFNV